MEEEKKLYLEYDKKIPNTIEMKVMGETHTLGNMVSEKLLEDKRCVFGAYKVEHPLKEEVKIKVTADNSIPVKSLVLDSLRSLENDIDDLISQFKDFENKHSAI